MKSFWQSGKTAGYACDLSGNASYEEIIVEADIIILKELVQAIDFSE